MITKLCNVSHTVQWKSVRSQRQRSEGTAEVALGKQTQTQKSSVLTLYTRSAPLSCLTLRMHCLMRNSGSRHQATLTAQLWARTLWVASEPSWGVRITLLWTTNITYSSFWLRCDSRILLDISCHNMWISTSPSEIHISQLIQSIWIKIQLCTLPG